MTDQHSIAEIAREFRPSLREWRRIRDRRIVDAMNAGRGWRNRLVRPHQTPERALAVDPADRQPHRRELDNARPAGIETGGFGVDDDRIQRDQRRGVCDHRHRSVLQDSAAA